MANIRQMQLTQATTVTLFNSLIVLSSGDKAILTSFIIFKATRRIDEIPFVL